MEEPPLRLVAWPCADMGTTKTKPRTMLQAAAPNVTDKIHMVKSKQGLAAHGGKSLLQ